jgi:recombination protein RecA
MAVDLGIVKKSGAWFTYEGEQLGQGRENAKTFLAENPEVMVEISDRVLVAAGLKPGSDPEPEPDPEPDPEPAAAAAAVAFTDADDAPINLD